MLDIQDIKDINKIVTGHGDVLSETMLESALSSYHYYDTIEEQICSVWRGLLKNHPFRDGNKRTALVCLSVMSEMNGVQLHLTNNDAFSYTVQVAESSLFVEDIAKLIYGEG